MAKHVRSLLSISDEGSEMHTGQHLLLDLYQCRNLKALSDLYSVFTLLAGIVDAADMHMVTQPQVYPWYPEDTQDGGITGFVVIAESHISVHTYPEQGRAYADVFSCKAFDVDLVQQMLVEWAGSEVFDSKVVSRGKKGP